MRLIGPVRAKHRKVATQAAMMAADLSVSGCFYSCEFSMPGGYARGLAVLGDPRRRPTAIFAASDEIAFGLILAARELGIRVPTELSVIGIDGHPHAEMFRLTTLAQHPRMQGELAVRTLLAELAARDGAKLRVHREGGAADEINLDGTDDSIVLPTNLVIRSSTSAPRARQRTRS